MKQLFLIRQLFLLWLGMTGSLAVFAQSHSLGELASLLQSPQHILMMRHADAPGYSDPAGFNLNDCSTQRNLGTVGKKQAQEIGRWLRTDGVTASKVFSSPWCRCQETASLLNLGPVTIKQSLGSFFENRSQRQEQTQQLEKTIQQELAKKGSAALIFVTHQVNIEAFTGEFVNSGQLVLVKVNSKGQYQSHRLIKAP
ncbi:MAG: histidine phosphatase family protein [Polynucleobacter sp.]|nr:MAG: histidine phosphatase family protein [Polynucleobacter sp.]